MKKIVALILTFLITFSLAACGESDSGDIENSTESEEVHIYDDAEIIDVMNGGGTSVVSQESLIYADSSDITIEDLEDWYFNYIKETEYDWYVIIYTDADDYTGVYGTTGYIEVGVTFEESSDEVFTESSTADSTMYVATDDGTLEEK